MFFTRQAALFVLDTRHQGGHLVGDEMVHPDRDPAAAGLFHESRGLLDRLRPVHLRSCGAGRPPGDVDGRAGRAQLHGDPPPRSAGRSGDQRNLAGQRCLHALSPMANP